MNESAWKDRSPEFRAYLRMMRALAQPNKVPETLNTFKVEPGVMTGWSDDDWTLMIEEGRRQLDAQTAGLDRVRDQARLLFSTAIALLLVMGVELRTVVSQTGLAYGLGLVGWTVATALTVLSLVASAGIATAAGRFNSINTHVLSHYQSPVRPKLAADYASMMKTGIDTINTLQTVFRYAVLNLCMGGLLQLAVWSVLINGHRS